jgi:uncharacterized protein (DUF1330 family)
MSAYIIADVTVTNAEQMAVYREWSTNPMQEHGRRGAGARRCRFEVLEGPLDSRRAW